MALSNLAGWNENSNATASACGISCGGGDKKGSEGTVEEKPAACGSSCGAGDKEENPAACGSACGAGDK